MFRYQQPLDGVSAALLLLETTGNARRHLLEKCAQPGVAWALGLKDDAKKLVRLDPHWFESSARRSQRLPDGRTFREALLAGLRQVRSLSKAKASTVLKQALVDFDDHPSTRSLEALVDECVDAADADVMWGVAVALEEQRILRSIPTRHGAITRPTGQFLTTTGLEEQQGWASDSWVAAVESAIHMPHRLTLDTLQLTLDALQESVPVLEAACLEAFDAMRDTTGCPDAMTEWLFAMEPVDMLKTFATPLASFRYDGYALLKGVEEPARGPARAAFERCVQAFYRYRDVFNDIASAKRKRTIHQHYVADLDHGLRAVVRAQGHLDSLGRPSLQTQDLTTYSYLACLATTRASVLVATGACMWRAPPGTLPKFYKVIVQAETIFKKANKKARAPFYILLDADQGRVVIDGETVPVPKCRITVEDGLVEIAFEEDHYDNLFQRQPIAVKVFPSGRAMFTDAGARELVPLLQHFEANAGHTLVRLVDVCKGRCIFCQRPLTTDASTTRGFGDACGEKFVVLTHRIRESIARERLFGEEVAAAAAAKRSRQAPAPRMNGLKVPKALLAASPLLQSIRDECSGDVAEAIPELLTLSADAELLEIVATWLSSRCSYVPTRAPEVANLCDKLAMDEALDKLATFCAPALKCVHPSMLRRS